MAQINVLNIQGEVISSLVLKDEVFAQEWNDQIIYDVVNSQRAAMRQGSSKTKNRSDVAGGGRKPYRQKGTGHARQGTIRAPQYRGGGHVFELNPRDYSFSVNKKVRRQAIRIALSAKLADAKLIVLDAINFDEPKTKAVEAMLKAISASGKTLIVVPEVNVNLELSARNLKSVAVCLENHASVYDILDAQTLVLTEAAAKYYEEALHE